MDGPVPCRDIGRFCWTWAWSLTLGQPLCRVCNPTTEAKVIRYVPGNECPARRPAAADRLPTTFGQRFQSSSTSQPHLTSHRIASHRITPRYASSHRNHLPRCQLTYLPATARDSPRASKLQLLTSPRHTPDTHTYRAAQRRPRTGVPATTPPVSTSSYPSVSTEESCAEITHGPHARPSIPRLLGGFRRL